MTVRHLVDISLKQIVRLINLNGSEHKGNVWNGFKDSKVYLSHAEKPKDKKVIQSSKSLSVRLSVVSRPFGDTLSGCFPHTIGGLERFFLKMSEVLRVMPFLPRWTPRYLKVHTLSTSVLCPWPKHKSLQLGSISIATLFESSEAKAWTIHSCVGSARAIVPCMYQSCLRLCVYALDWSLSLPLVKGPAGKVYT